MTLPLQAVPEATPEKLTTRLEAAGLLSGERVTNVRVQETDAFNSTVAHLELHFDKPRTPMKLLLKLNRENAGREEVAFYDLAAKIEGDTSMLVPCISAVFDPTSGASHLLLLDVSETHEAPVPRKNLLGLEGVPTGVKLRAVTEALARFYATFWEHPFLDKHTATQLTERYQDAAAFGAWWDKHRQDYGQFANEYGQTVSAEIHTLLQDALEHHGKLWARHIAPRSHALSGLSVTHNDCYLTQFLSPKGAAGETYLVDFQGACTDFAARDLVYLMATFWTREQRSVHEQGVLEHYHSVLLGAACVTIPSSSSSTITA